MGLTELLVDELLSRACPHGDPLRSGVIHGLSVVAQDVKDVQVNLQQRFLMYHACPKYQAAFFFDAAQQSSLISLKKKQR